MFGICLQQWLKFGFVQLQSSDRGVCPAFGSILWDHRKVHAASSRSNTQKKSVWKKFKTYFQVVFLCYKSVMTKCESIVPLYHTDQQNILPMMRGPKVASIKDGAKCIGRQLTYKERAFKVDKMRTNSSCCFWHPCQSSQDTSEPESDSSPLMRLPSLLLWPHYSWLYLQEDGYLQRLKGYLCPELFGDFRGRWRLFNSWHYHKISALPYVFDTSAN